jgi:hypothetical protein
MAIGLHVHRFLREKRMKDKAHKPISNKRCKYCKRFGKAVVLDDNRVMILCINHMNMLNQVKDSISKMRIKVDELSMINRIGYIHNKENE